jgi:hypothetical protein
LRAVIEANDIVLRDYSHLRYGKIDDGKSPLLRLEAIKLRRGWLG